MSSVVRVSRFDVRKCFEDTERRLREPCAEPRPSTGLLLNARQNIPQELLYLVTLVGLRFQVDVISLAAVGGAQLMARGRSDIALYDALIDNYRAVGLLTA